MEAKNPGKLFIFAIVGAIFLLVGILGFGAHFFFQKQKGIQYADQLFLFFQEELPKWEEEKRPVSFLEKEYEAVTKTMEGHEGLVFSHLQMANLFTKKKAFPEAQALLERGFQAFPAPVPRYFYATRLAILHENKREYAKAIEYLQGLLQGPSPFLKGKIYLDIGRLQRLQGNIEKAKLSFEWASEKASDKAFRRMALLYLSEL